jgi:hypothetical protein
LVEQIIAAVDDTERKVYLPSGTDEVLQFFKPYPVIGKKENREYKSNFLGEECEDVRTEEEYTKKRFFLLIKTHITDETYYQEGSTDYIIPGGRPAHGHVVTGLQGENQRSTKSGQAMLAQSPVEDIEQHNQKRIQDNIVHMIGNRVASPESIVKQMT